MNRVFLVFLLALISIKHCYSQNKKYKIVNLKINNSNNHFGVSYFKGNTVVFTSNLLNKRGKVKLINGTPQLTLYLGEINPDGNITDVKPLPKKIEGTVFNFSAAVFSLDRKTMFVTTNLYNSKRNDKLQQGASKLTIQQGEYIEDVGWTNFKPLSFCKARYSYGHPALSPDGKYLYFVSNMRGTVGSTDIFRVQIDEAGNFGTPENLGPSINTRKKELFPFISADNHLYFSSNRPSGHGKLDVYRSKIQVDGSLTSPELLNDPINSRLDDYGFILNSDLTSGYFTSSRPGGQGGDDLYYFTEE